MKDLNIVLLINIIVMIMVIPAAASQNLASRNIQENSAWNIGGGYFIMVEGLDIEGAQAFMSIRKEGEILKDDLIQPGEKFEYRDPSETLIISMKLDSIFRGTEMGTCTFTNIYLRFSESHSTPTPTDTATSAPTIIPQETAHADDTHPVSGLSTPLITVIGISVLIVRRSYNW